MSVNRKAVVIYGSTDLWIYWDKADKLRLFYRDSYIPQFMCEAGAGTIDNKPQISVPLSIYAETNVHVCCSMLFKLLQCSFCRITLTE